MSKRLLIVGNWKMNLAPHQASLLVHRLDSKITAQDNVSVVLCPPFIDLQPLLRGLDRKKFALGAQNAFHVDEGPYTGEISAAMLKGLADYVIVGHSERRQHAGETDSLIAKKLAAVIRNGLRPILCVGDRLIDREHGHAARTVVDQLTVGLSDLSQEEIGELVVAYEPVWAISKGDGHGTFAKPNEVTPIVKAIRETLDELYGEGSKAVPLLYGGSVNPDNCRAYLELAGIDGLLVGGASLNYEEFAKIVAVAQEVG